MPPAIQSTYVDLLYHSSADSFTILPTIQMGTIYMAIGNVYSFDYPNVAMAVAYEDNTIVSEIHDKFVYKINNLFWFSIAQITIGVQQVSLNALQVVTLAIRGIISGITITGTKPFAAFSGNMFAKMRPTDQHNYITVIRFDNRTMGWSPSVQWIRVVIFLQTTLLPTAVWGTQFPLVPFVNVTNQQYQIVANTFGTIVSADGRQYTLNAGEYLIINVTDTAMLTSNYPIQMVQMGQVQQLFIIFSHKAMYLANR